MGTVRSLIRLGLGFSLCWLAVGLPAEVRAANTSYTVGGISFETPVPFSDPTPLGRQGVGVLYPSTATNGSQQFKFSLIELPLPLTRVEQLNEEELFNLVKFSFMGINSPAIGFQERMLMGRWLRGEVLLRQNHRTQSYMEIYLLPMSAGYTLAVVFEADTRLPMAQVEAMITTIGRTMRELPPDPKREKRRRKQAETQVGW